MTDLSMVLPVTAALINLVGFTLYNIQTKLGESDPNPVSWFLWAFFATLNAFSFSAMNDPIAALQFFSGSVGCTVTFLYVLFIGRFKWPTRREWVMLTIGVVTIFVWREFTATIANMILAGLFLYSLGPTVQGVWANPFKEKPIAWYLWTIAFTITGMNTYFYKGGWTLSMVVPIIGVTGHWVVAILCRNSRKQLFLR